MFDARLRGLSRCTVKRVLPLVTIFTFLCVVYGTTAATASFGQIGDTTWTYLAIGVCTAGTLVAFVWRVVDDCKECRRKRSAETAPAAGPLAALLEVPARHDAKPRRLYYLDNIKTFLTAIVVLHHCTVSISLPMGWMLVVAAYRNSFQPFANTIVYANQSYFMWAFFFISGVVAPRSLDKKGRVAYLRTKFFRLGVPLMLYGWVIGPIADNIGNAARGSAFVWQWSSGPCWFLIWLLLFHTSYALTGGDPFVLSPKWLCARRLEIVHDERGGPSRMRETKCCYASRFAAVLATTLLLSLLQLFISNTLYLQGQFSFVQMPISNGSLPWDATMFILGILAARGDWLRPEAHRVALVEPTSFGSDAEQGGEEGGSGGGGEDEAEAAVREEEVDDGATAAPSSVPSGVASVADAAQCYRSVAVETKPSSLLHRPPIALLSPSETWCARLTSLVLILGYVFVGIICNFTHQTETVFRLKSSPWASGTFTPISSGIKPDPMPRWFVILTSSQSGAITSFFYWGVCGMATFLAMLDFFSKFCNHKPGALGAAIVSAAYPVYLIHPIVITPLLLLYVSIMHTEHGVDFKYSENTKESMTDLGNDAYVWLMWAFLVVGSLALVWPAAWVLKQVWPLSKVL